MTTPREQMAVPRPQPYVYRSRLKRGAASAFDAAGSLLWRPSGLPIPWEGARRVAVLRLDHMGDVLMALPAVEALRRRLPRARVTLFVAPWGREAATLGGAEVRVVQAPWFRRPSAGAGQAAAVRALAEALHGHDVGIDLRGDLRHLVALKRSGIPWRAGLTGTGGRFLLTHPVDHDPALHEMEQNYHVMESTGLKLEHRLPELAVPAAATRSAGQIRAGLKLSGPLVVFQAACGAPSREWLPERWAALIDSLPRPFRAVLLGSREELEGMKALAARCRRKPALATGAMDIPELAAFLKHCRLMVSLNTGPAHLAAAMGTPVLSLFAGTDETGRWAPRGPRVRVLQSAVPCAPCNLTHCPFDNECMRLISVEAATRAMKEML